MSAELGHRLQIRMVRLVRCSLIIETSPPLDRIKAISLLLFDSLGVSGIVQQMIDSHPILISSRTRALLLLFIAASAMDVVWAHGRLLDPPSRSSAWRVGFNTPRDYNDMETFCGGFERQWLVNKGKCGICGDPYDEVIKPHEAPGGAYATGTIVRRYRQGQVIQVKLDITATHRGFYEFKLCPNNNPRQDPTQECFERFPLRFIDDGRTTRYSLDNLRSGMYRLRLQLPPDVTCSQCIIQWTYTTGNRWGICPNGTGALGCGPQEQFRACADVAITRTGVDQATTTPLPTTAATEDTTPTTTVVTPTTTRSTRPTRRPVAPVPADLGATATGCHRYVPVGVNRGLAGMDSWCENNCRRGYCPEAFCRCEHGEKTDIGF